MPSKTLIPGENQPVSGDNLQISVQLSPTEYSGLEVDISAFLLTANGKVRGDSDMVFYGQPSSDHGAVILSNRRTGHALFLLDLTKLDPAIEKIAFTATIHKNKQTFSAFKSLTVSVQAVSAENTLEAVLPTTGMLESALILGEVYRRQGQWKFRSVGQGFTGGLKTLAEFYGVEISDAPEKVSVSFTPMPAAYPTAPTTLNLDKSRPVVSLDKNAQGFGEIKINLHWRQPTSNPQKTGLLGGLFSTKSSAVDLNIGCLYELYNGKTGAIQTLNHPIGSFEQEPYILLKANDQTGASIKNQWLHLNKQHWSKFKRLLIFAYIQEGSPNWAAIEAALTIEVEGETPLQIQLLEGSRVSNVCAIVLLENQADGLMVTRQARYFSGHKAMNKYYQWGLTVEGWR